MGLICPFHSQRLVSFTVVPRCSVRLCITEALRQLCKSDALRSLRSLVFGKRTCLVLTRSTHQDLQARRRSFYSSPRYRMLMRCQRHRRFAHSAQSNIHIQERAFLFINFTLLLPEDVLSFCQLPQYSLWLSKLFLYLTVPA